jgi:hypothetical protein
VRRADEPDSAGSTLALEPGETLLPCDQVVDLLEIDAAADLSEVIM